MKSRRCSLTILTSITCRANSKISISGCQDWCSYPEINDLAFTPVVREVAGKREVGFSIRVRGGLSTEPHLAVRLNAFVRWEQVIPVTKAVSELFRDATPQGQP